MKMIRALFCLSLTAGMGLFAQVIPTQFRRELSPATLMGENAIGIAVPGPVIAVETQHKAQKPFKTHREEIAAPAPPPVLLAPAPAPLPIAAAGAGFAGFLGLTHLDQRLAGTGVYANTQFSSEPPDHMLAAGNGFVLEGVNTALAAYDAKTHKLLSGPTPLNQFFKLAPEIVNRTSANPVFGPFVSDPRAYFDPETRRWFVTLLEIDTNPATGVFAGKSHILLAVSKTADPTASWFLFSIDTTNDGNAIGPNGPICPCFGDQPLIGADGNGFFITTNSFSIAQPFSTGAQIYAMAKLQLTAGVTPNIVHISGLSVAGNIAFSIQPAIRPPSEAAEPGHGGTEFFLSSLDPNATLDNRLAVWAITNTFSLNQGTADIDLKQVIIQCEVYGQPPAGVAQKPGPTPLGTLVGNPLELLAANDDRMNQVYFANGILWSGVNTIIAPQPPAAPRSGVAWFAVRPSLDDDKLDAKVVNQGYVTIAGGSVLFPAVAVNGSGHAVMTHTIVSPTLFPSAAYTLIDAEHKPTSVKLAGPGAAPEDGFSGYKAFGGAGIARWGDYSAAATDSDGNVWIATEFIPNAPRATLANWGTFIGKVTVTGDDGAE